MFVVEVAIDQRAEVPPDRSKLALLELLLRICRMDVIIIPDHYEQELTIVVVDIVGSVYQPGDILPRVDLFGFISRYPSWLRYPSRIAPYVEDLESFGLLVMLSISLFPGGSCTNMYL